MKLRLLSALLFLCSMTVNAQNDPTIMTVNGQPVSRSEFEYSYNKNNSEGVIDKKTVEEYVDLFVNYKLKVIEAYAARLDTLSSFKSEFTMYRDQQILPTFVEDSDVEAEAKKVYDETLKRIGPAGLIMPAHILLRVPQDATAEQKNVAKQRIDSIYNALKGGADFADLAKRLSQDPGTARNGGLLPWIESNQTVKEFNDAAFALEVGEMSEPVLSPFGYHIIMMKDRKQLEPFDTLKSDILKFLENRNVRDRIAKVKIDELVKQSEGKLTKDDILNRRSAELEASDSDMRNLIREYHDGLLLYEISNRNVWDKAAKDEEGLAAYFKKNKKKYNWERPRFKGMAYHVKVKDDVKAVRDCVKNIPFSGWADKLRTTFNNDTIIRIRVEKGLFKEGDNAFIDKMVFKKDTTVSEIKGYPIDATYGKLLKKGPESYEDVRGLVTADYQEMLEKQWVAELRKKYPVVINKEVLETVNKHD